MHRRWYILGAGLVALAVIAVAAGVLRTRADAQRMEMLEPRLSDPDPRGRLLAAQGMLAIDPDHRGARSAAAWASLELGRGDETRRHLDALSLRLDKPDDQAHRLAAECALLEAAETVAATPAIAMDGTAERIEALLSEAAGHREALSAGAEAEALSLESRELDLRGAYRSVLRRQRLGLLARNETAGVAGDSGAILADEVTRLTGELQKINDRIEQIARRMAEMAPRDTRPRQVLFHALLRAGDADGARRTAEALATADHLSYAAAGDVADTLLNLERLALPPARGDLELVARLLEHGNLSGAPDLRYQIARATLALRRDTPVEAAELSRATLDQYPAHPRATAVLGVALARSGQTDEALSLLRRLVDRSNTPEAMMALAEAVAAAGDVKQSRVLLRQAVEKHGDHLALRLALAESLTRGGHVIEAERDIAAAEALCPEHPLLREIRSRLWVEKLDRPAMVAALKAEYRERPPTWADAAAAAAMILDDRAAATRHAATLDPDTQLRLLADAWAAAQPRHRMESAVVIARAVLDAVDADPMLRAEPPKVVEFGVARPARDRNADVAPVPEALHRGCFVPMPIEIGTDLVAAALLRWPDRAELQTLQIEHHLWLSGTAPEATLAVSQSSESPAALFPALAAAVRDHGDAIAALDRLLRAHPWAEPALLLVIRDALDRGDADAATRAIERARGINPALADLAEARMHLAAGRLTEAIAAASALTRSQETDSELRCQAAGVSARANLPLYHVELASGVLDTLALSHPHQRLALKTYGADALIAAGRTSAAGAIASLLTEPGLEPRWLDLLLSRAERAMPTERRAAILQTLLSERPGEPVLLYYQARLLAETGDARAAQKEAESLRVRRPDAARVQTLLARLAEAAEAGDVNQTQANQPRPAGEPVGDAPDRSGAAATQEGTE